MIRKARNKYVSCSSRIHMIRHNFHNTEIKLYCFSSYRWASKINRKKLIYLHAQAKALIGSELRVTSLQGKIQEFFIGVGGGPNFGSERTVELFCGKLLFPTPPPISHCEGRDDYVFLNLWKLVAVGAGNTQSTEGTQRQSHFWISLEFSLVAKYNTRFIKKFSQLNSDIQSYRCKDFSLKQVSGLMGGRGGGVWTPGPSPWIRHCFGALWYPFYSIR